MANEKYPFGNADHQQPAYAATITVDIVNSKTIIEPAILTGNLTLNVNAHSEQQVGDEVIVKVKTTATETTTFGSGINGVALVGVAGKTKTKLFVYDGSNFISTNEQID